MENTAREAAPIYGVTFYKGERQGTRIYSAVGMVAEVGVDDQEVRNDFDHVMPWAGMRRCNTAFVNGERVPTHFEGEDGYDNKNADVFVYVPLFFYVLDFDGRECKICMDKRPGYEAPAKFRRKDGTYRDFVFLPAYTAGLVNGIPASRSGLDPFITNLNGWMEITAGMGDICIESTMDDEIKNVLLDVEFANRDPQSIMAGATRAEDVFKSGECDGVKASSGSPISNTSGKFPCKYRGIENPWGNQFRFRWNVLVKDRVPHVLDDPRKYNRGKVTADYKPLSYKLANADGWAHKMGHDERFPHVSLPVTVADSYEESSFGCYFWQWSHGTYALLVGGHVTHGRNAGARYCSVISSPGSAYWYIGAALSPA